MHLRTAAAAFGVGLALTLTACSSSDSPDRAPASTASAAPSRSVDQAAARKACVAAWVDQMDAGTAEGDVPAACDGLEGAGTDLYMEALRQHNKDGRGRLGDCLSDPTCTGVPVP